MKIYTLFYKDTNLFNKQIFVMPNDETAKKAMKLNLMDRTTPQTERFRDEARLGNTELVSLIEFSEEYGIEGEVKAAKTICNLKELLDDDNRDMESAKSDNT